MKKEVALKWIEALRSGEYKQTKRQLRDSKGFCCLGVLCDISFQGEWLHETGGYQYSGAGTTSCGAALPVNVRDWAGMASQMGYRGPGKQELFELNDNGMTFGEIADIIEKEWENL